MSTVNLSVILTLDDQLTAALQKTNAAVNKISKDVEDFGKTLKTTGKELAGLGRDLSFFGAGAIAPFVLALDKAAKSSDEVAHALRVVDSISQQFFLTISTSVLPLLKDFAFQLNNLLTWFNSLSQSTRDFIIQGTIITGVFLTFSGAVTFVIGKIVGLVANLSLLGASFMAFAAANVPLIAIAVTVGSIIYLMFQLKAVADVVMNTLQVGFNIIKGLVLGLKIDFELLTATLLESVGRIVEALAKIPGPTQQAFQGLNDWISQGSESMRKMADQDFQALGQSVQTVSSIIATGQGTWAQGFDFLKGRAEDFVLSLQKIGAVGAQSNIAIKNTFKDFVATSTSVLGTLSASLNGAATQNKKFAVAAKASSMGLAIINTAQGATKALADWGFPLGPIFAAIIGAAGAIQISTIAGQSFAVGTPNVPSDMTAQIHKGEGIVPATFMDGIRQGQLTLGGPGAGSGGAPTYVFNITGNNIDSEDRVRQLVEMVGYEMQRTSRFARGI